MHLYSQLAKYQKHRKSLVRNSEESNFYFQNRSLLNGIENYKFLINAIDDFDIIRANIVIRAMLNKKQLDKTIIHTFKESKFTTEEAKEFIHETMTGLPYIQEGNIKIYVPIFNRQINKLYFDEFGKLLVSPYSTILSDNFASSCIDLFEMYGFELYDSLFSKFVVIERQDKIIVLYHFDFQTIYFVNDQGRLEAKLALFDKYLRHPDNSNIIERIKPAIEAYLSDDREGLYQALVINKLISKKLIFKIKHNEFKFNRYKERKANRV